MRSLLFVPGHVERFIVKALETETHAIIFDLEDAVPSAQRVDARKILTQASSQARTKAVKFIVRINPFQTNDYDLDLQIIKGHNIDYLMPTKANSGAELKRIFESTGLPQIPLIETAKGLVEVNRIAELPFVEGLALGAEDLMDDLGVKAPGYRQMLMNSQINVSVACKAAKKSCFDTPFLSLDDLEGYSSRCRESYGIGFTGRLCIHPSQISPTNRYYYPSPEEQQFAKEIQEKIDEAGSSGYSVIRWKGELVGPPMVKRAMSILKAMNDD